MTADPHTTVERDYAVSRAMHHHTYELAPTLAELLSWHDDVGILLDRLAQPDP